MAQTGTRLAHSDSANASMQSPPENMLTLLGGRLPHRSIISRFEATFTRGSEHPKRDAAELRRHFESLLSPLDVDPESAGRKGRG